MLIVAFVSFSLFNFVGDPVNNMVGQEASDERREEIREKLGINDPIYIQFFNFVGNSIQGNFGISYQIKRPVSVLIAERMPAIAVCISPGLFLLPVKLTGFRKKPKLSTTYSR